MTMFWVGCLIGAERVGIFDVYFRQLAHFGGVQHSDAVQAALAPPPGVQPSPASTPAKTKHRTTSQAFVNTRKWEYHKYRVSKVTDWDEESAKKYSFYAGEIGSAWIEDVINGKDVMSSQYEECLRIPVETAIPNPKQRPPSLRRLAGGYSVDATEADFAAPCPLEVVTLQVKEEEANHPETSNKSSPADNPAVWSADDAGSLGETRRSATEAVTRAAVTIAPTATRRAAATSAAHSAAPPSPGEPSRKPKPSPPQSWWQRFFFKYPTVTKDQREWAQSLLTKAECKEAFGSNPGAMRGGRTTCRLQNAFVSGLKITGHFLAGQLPPTVDLQQDYGHISSGTGSGFDMQFEIKEHRNIDDYYRFLMSPRGNYTHMPGYWVAFAPLWHFNPGHALFDGLYPIFTSMMLWGLQDVQFTSYLLCGSCREAQVERQLPGSYASREKVFAKFSGNGTLRSGLAPPIGLMDDVVFGIGNNGQKTDHSVNVTLGACRELDACRVFRERMYKQYGFDPPAPASSRIGQKRKAIVIENARYNTSNLTKAVAAVKADLELSNVDISLISWSPAKQRQTGDFADHLAIIRETDIHISGPGTGMMYQTFLPDGAVHINLGAEEGECPRNYMEEYMAEGSPYLHALYNIYPRPEIPSRVVVELTRKAYKLLEENHPLPIPVGESLSPVGLIFKAYMWRRYLGTNEEHSLRMVAALKTIPGAPTNGNNNFFEKWSCYGGRSHRWFDSSSTTQLVQKKDACLMKALRTSFDKRFPKYGPRGNGWFML